MKKYAVYGPGQVDKVPYHNKKHVYACLNAVPDIGGLVLGGGKGVEALARRWAEEMRIDYVEVPPPTELRSTIGIQGVFTLRDAEMLSLADGCIIFSNPGIPYIGIISAAIAAKKTVLVFHV